jgi:hypothetical protein
VQTWLVFSSQINSINCMNQSGSVSCSLDLCLLELDLPPPASAPRRFVRLYHRLNHLRSSQAHPPKTVGSLQLGGSRAAPIPNVMKRQQAGEPPFWCTATEANPTFSSSDVLPTHSTPCTAHVKRTWISTSSECVGPPLLFFPPYSRRSFLHLRSHKHERRTTSPPSLAPSQRTGGRSGPNHRLRCIRSPKMEIGRTQHTSSPSFHNTQRQPSTAPNRNSACC